MNILSGKLPVNDSSYDARQAEEGGVYPRKFRPRRGVNTSIKLSRRDLHNNIIKPEDDIAYVVGGYEFFTNDNKKQQKTIGITLTPSSIQQKEIGEVPATEMSKQKAKLKTFNLHSDIRDLQALKMDELKTGK